MIEFDKVGKQFRKQQVLASISLQMPVGERIALVGSNGAGKTTLIRCLLGEYQHEGKVLVDGVAPRQARQAVLSRFGFVPQLPPPLRMPVGQLIRYTAELCRADVEQIHHIAALLGFDCHQFYKQPFVRLSGGQKQKLLIALALGRDSDILILDEPAANLDPEARKVLFDLLSARQNHSVMMISSHRLDEVAPLVNRVIELDQGRVVLDDRVEELSDMSAKLYCELRLLRDEPAFSNAIVEWGFVQQAERHWCGEVAGPDRLRFMGLLARYAGLFEQINMGAQTISAVDSLSAEVVNG